MLEGHAENFTFLSDSSNWTIIKVNLDWFWENDDIFNHWQISSNKYIIHKQINILIMIQTVIKMKKNRNPFRNWISEIEIFI